MIENVRMVQQHFRGDAADVQARATQKTVFFHDQGL
jgi:hypothetical protein